MAKYTAKDWDDIRTKFRNSIMADTSLVSLAQNLEIKDWPLKADDEKPTKYINFNYEELLMLPEIAGKTDRADHLASILSETLSFDDPFGDMVAQVEETSAKENPILKTLSRLSIPEPYPLSLVVMSDGTRSVCSSEGIKTIGEFANLGQQMSTRIVLGGDFRHMLNALTHGDEEGIGKFLPYRRGATGLHLAEALGLAVAMLPRPEQLALAKSYGTKVSPADAAAAKTMGPESLAKTEAVVRRNIEATLGWFKDQQAALVKNLSDGASLERYLVTLNDPACEAVAARLTGDILKSQLARTKPAAAAAAAGAEKKAGLFSRLFGKR